jgi:hypothetical protein
LRYTQLLEKRIAQLEALVNGTSKSSDADKKESKNDDGKKAEGAGATKVRRTISGSNPSLVEADRFYQDKETESGNKKEGEVTSGGRYRNILRKWDASTGSHKDEVVGEATLKKPELKDVAYTFRRVYDPQTGEKGAYSELDIEDEGLIALLRSVIDNKYPGINFDGDLVNMSAPFAPIVRPNRTQGKCFPNNSRFITGINCKRDLRRCQRPRHPRTSRTFCNEFRQPQSSKNILKSVKQMRMP